MIDTQRNQRRGPVRIGPALPRGKLGRNTESIVTMIDRAPTDTEFKRRRRHDTRDTFIGRQG